MNSATDFYYVKFLNTTDLDYLLFNAERFSISVTFSKDIAFIVEHSKIIPEIQVFLKEGDKYFHSQRLTSPNNYDVNYLSFGDTFHISHDSVYLAVGWPNFNPENNKIPKGAICIFANIQKDLTKKPYYVNTSVIKADLTMKEKKNNLSKLIMSFEEKIYKVKQLGLEVVFSKKNNVMSLQVSGRKYLPTEDTCGDLIEIEIPNRLIEYTGESI